MTLKLTDNDFHELIAILSNWRGYLTCQDRIDLASTAFAGEELKRDCENISMRLTFDGPSRDVAIDTIVGLADYGQLRTGEEAVLRYLKTFAEKLTPDNAAESELKSRLNKILPRYDVFDGRADGDAIK